MRVYVNANVCVHVCVRVDVDVQQCVFLEWGIWVVVVIYIWCIPNWESKDQRESQRPKQRHLEFLMGEGGRWRRGCSSLPHPSRTRPKSILFLYYKTSLPEPLLESVPETFEPLPSTVIFTHFVCIYNLAITIYHSSMHFSKFEPKIIPALVPSTVSLLVLVVVVDICLFRLFYSPLCNLRKSRLGIA